MIAHAATPPQGAFAGRVSLDAPHGVFAGPALVTDAVPADERMRKALELADNDIAVLVAQLLPAYVAARDTLDAPATAQAGGVAVGIFTRICAAHAAVIDLRGKLACSTAPNGASAVGTHLPGRIPELERLLRSSCEDAFRAFVPHQLHGVSVADVVPVLDDGVTPEQVRARITTELDRTLALLATIADTRALLAKPNLDNAEIKQARDQIIAWQTRPIDLAFIRVALGPEAWVALDTDALPKDNLDNVLGKAVTQARYTGWFEDTRGISMPEIAMYVAAGDAELVLARIKAIPDGGRRAHLLEQMRDNDLLSPFLSALGWREIKELHDELGVGSAEIKTLLQAFFLGDDKFGPSLGEEWETHDTSVSHYLSEVPVVGGWLNQCLNNATFGFSSAYGKARDQNTEGKIGDHEYARQVLNLSERTAAITVVSMATGGAADKLVRGGAATVGTARAFAAGAAGGSAGAMAGLATSDAFNMYVSGDQVRFSSLGDYLKTALEGGAFGGAAGADSDGRTRVRALSKPPADPADRSHSSGWRTRNRQIWKHANIATRNATGYRSGN